jgi:hypothetical protein
MMAQSASDAGDVTADWELDVTDSPLLQILTYVCPSVFGGVAILAGGLLLWLVVSAVLDGDLARAVGVVAFAVLALLSRRYLPALLETNLTDPFWNRYSRRGLVIGSVCGALVLLGSAQLHPTAPFVVFIASWLPLVLTAAFPTSGHADPAAGTLVVDDTEVPLDAVSEFRAVSVGTFAVCWLSYTRGVPTAPRIILLPPNYVDVVAELIETGTDSSTRGRSTIDRTERLIAGLFGLGMVALGPILWLLLPPGEGQVVALYAGAMFGLFGMMLLWYTYSA